MASLSAKHWFILAGVSVSLFSTTVSTMAATNPIDATLAPTTGFPAITQGGNSYSVVYTLSNNLPFAEPLKQVLQTIVGLGFTVDDACSNTTLAPKGAPHSSCLISIGFKPTQLGAASIQLTMQYDRNVVPLAPLTTTVVTSPTPGPMTGSVTGPLPASTVLSALYPVQFTFNNTSDQSITASSIQFTGDTTDLSQIQNGCIAPVAAHSSCIINANFIPSTVGATAVGVTYFYENNTRSVPLSTNTVVSNGGGSCTAVNGLGDLLLPTQTYLYADNVVRFQFTNHCQTAEATLAEVHLSATLGSGTTKRPFVVQSKNKATTATTTSRAASTAIPTGLLTPGEDGCSGVTLTPGHSCFVTASIIPQSTGSHLVVSAMVDYSQSGTSQPTSASTTATAVLPNDDTNRMITIINQCKDNVWMSFNAGSVSNGGHPCTPGLPDTQACPSYSVCNVNADGGRGLCYWANPSLDGAHPNGLLMGAASNVPPDTMNIAIPETNGSPGSVVYNGGILGRLQCTGNGTNVTCGINTCGAGPDGLCFPGNGAGTPPVAFNAVEFTFNRTGADGIYDDQILEGINIPIEMKGRGSFSLGTAPYNNCQAAGAIIQAVTHTSTTQLGNCNYVFNAPGDPTNYRYVTPIGAPSQSTLCDTNADCSGGAICGLGYDPNSNKINKICGSLQGYVSVHKGICSQGKAAFGVNKSGQKLGDTVYDATFHCDETFDAGAYSAANLYGCSGPLHNSSCYNDASPCCGCIDWWEPLGGSITVPTSTVSCQGVTNIHWNSLAQPTVQWQKAACPTAYVYQYDDKSSSFTCTVTNGDNNVVTNYQVTFCPGGKSLSNN